MLKKKQKKYRDRDSRKLSREGESQKKSLAQVQNWKFSFTPKGILT